MSEEPTLEFKFRLLLASSNIRCKFYKGGFFNCGLAAQWEPDDENSAHQCHKTLNCGGDINQCDLPDKFSVYLI